MKLDPVALNVFPLLGKRKGGATALILRIVKNHNFGPSVKAEPPSKLMNIEFVFSKNSGAFKHMTIS